MTTPAAEPSAIRIGSTERQQAMDALDAHLDAGRLDAEEYGERVGRTSVARTVEDLRPLFADLPEPHPAVLRPGFSSVAGPVATAPSAPPVQLSKKEHKRNSALGGRYGETAVAVMPFLALALFFIVGSWLWFLLVPAAGAIVYGGGGNRNRDRNRNR